MYFPSVYYFCSYPPKTRCTLSSPLCIHYLDQVFLLVKIFSVIIAFSHLLGVCFRSTFLWSLASSGHSKLPHFCSAGSLTVHDWTVQFLTQGLDLHTVSAASYFVLMNSLKGHSFLWGFWVQFKHDILLFGSSPNRRMFWSLFTKVILKGLEPHQWCSASHPYRTRIF